MKWTGRWTGKWTGLMLCAMLLAPTIACAQEAQSLPTIKLPAEAERVLRDYEAAWTGRDPAKLANLFHPEGFVMSMGVQPVKGREAIQKHYARAGGPLHLRAIGYAASDTIGYIVGMFRGNGPTDGGKFVLALFRSNAKEPWLIAVDMDNTIGTDR
jgi:ketosteroid isomerase-like protein